MKSLVAIIASLFAFSVYAGNIESITHARVISVDPITVKSYRTVPRESCRLIEEHIQDNSGAVVGAIVGGAIGRNMAKDKDAGTVVGALAGASIGGQNPKVTSRTVERCSTYHDREYFEKITGYNVMFEWAGHVRTARMNRDPGNTVTIRVVTNVYAME